MEEKAVGYEELDTGFGLLTRRAGVKGSTGLEFGVVGGTHSDLLRSVEHGFDFLRIFTCR